MWVNPDPDGKVQATWKDSKGRTQYGYGAAAVAARDAKTFGAVHAFATSLPHIRAQVQRGLALEDAHKKRVAAAAISLIDHAHLRVGSERYAQENETFGASSLRADHAAVQDGAVTLRFTGKHNVAHETTVDDAPTARAAAHLKSLPADEGAQTRLFRYHEGAAQALRPLTDVHVNDYLHAFGVTAKQFRTHDATSAAASLLAEAGAPASETEARTTITRVVKTISDQLGNTPAVCRGSSINPAVLNAYSKGIVMETASAALADGAALMAQGSDRRFDAYLQRLYGRLMAGDIMDNDPFPLSTGMSEDEGAMGETHETINLTDVAEFSLTASSADKDDAATVSRTGLIFKAGDYRPKRDFVMTADEIRQAAAAFSGPVDLELEHITSNGVKTFLDGKLGKLVSVWASDDGAEMFGTVEAPRWLDRLWAEAGRKVSTVWDLIDGKKRLVRLGLCLNPVVKEAALFAEYAAFADATFASVGFSGKRHSDADMADLQMIHDVSVKQGASCPLIGSEEQQQSRTPAQNLQPLINGQTTHSPFAQGQTAQGDTTMPEPTTPLTTTEPTVTPVTVAQFAEMQTQFTRVQEAVTALQTANTTLAAQNTTLMANYTQERRKRIQSEAVAFADAQITANKAFPYQRETLVTRYMLAVEDDALHGAVTFGQNADGTEQQTSRLALLTKEFVDIVGHTLTTEQVSALGDLPKGGTRLFGLPNAGVTPGAQGAQTPSVDEEADAMLKMTQLGRLTIASRANGSTGSTGTASTT